MSVEREFDLEKRIRMWTVYDRVFDEVVKIIMEDGYLQFYVPIDDWPRSRMNEEKKKEEKKK